MTYQDFEFNDLVKKGDAITVRVTTEWLLNEQVIRSQWTAQVNGVDVVSGHTLTGWDKSAQRIVGFGFDSLGIHGQGIVQKRDGKWFESGMGVGPMGHVGAGTSIHTFVDGDTREILELGRLSPGGEPLPNQKLTWTRLQN